MGKTKAKAVPVARAPEPTERPTLEMLLANLGSTVANLIVAPHGLEIGVGEPTIYDPLERSPIEAAAIVLAVGTPPGSPQAARLIKDAAGAGASAIVFKHTDETASVADAAEGAGIAALSVPEEMTWTQLHTLLTGAVRFAGPQGTIAGLTGVAIGDLFALANAIAGMVGGAVTIEDPHRRVLAYSTLQEQSIDQARRTSILGRQVPDFPGVRELYRRVWEATDVLRADRALLRSLLGSGEEFTDLQARTAIALRAGTEIIGSIWVAHGSTPLSADAEQALIDAARVAVPHVIQARASRDVERRMRADMLRALLEGRGSGEATARRLGIAPSGPLTVLAFRILGSDASLEELQRERLVDLVAVYCEAFRRQAAAVAIGPAVYALVPVDKQMDRARILRLAAEIAGHAEERLRTPLHAAAGSTIAKLRDLPRARREADRVLQVLAGDRKRRTLAAIEQVRSEVFLLELRDLITEHPELRGGKLADLIAYDAEHGSAYTETLRAHLDAFGDIPTAAGRISVHPNTFRYRLRRLLALFDLDIDDPEERLVLALQFRLLPAGEAP